MARNSRKTQEHRPLKPARRKAAGWLAERAAVAETARQIADLGLVSGSSGNVSVRIDRPGAPPLLAITPAGKLYGSLKTADIVVCDYEMETLEGDLAPSSESLLHVGVYVRRPDVVAVVHTHSLHSSVMAVTGSEVPLIVDEMAVILGGPVRVSKYAFPGTQELADYVCDALGDRAAAIIRNHGAVGVGATLREALNACILTERVAQIYIYASLLGKVTTPPPEALEREQAIYQMRRHRG
ncbi:MAG: class II aldolase/adducin family protein [SAR202 cluster bacterium]|nr:class II aldolase/adducin family protein [SAR202 cluster bacterium]